MKRTVFAVFALLASTLALTQEIQYETMLGENSSYWEYFLNGKTYTPLYICFETKSARAMQNTTQDEPRFFPVDDQLMVFAIREEGGRIYVDKDDYMEYLKGNRAIKTASASSFIPYPVTDDGEVVLYDFNMQVGDKFPETEGRETVFVEGIEMIKCLDNTERKLFHLSNGCDSTTICAFSYEYALEHSKDIIDRYMDDTSHDNDTPSIKPLLDEGKCWTMSYKAVLPREYGDVYTFKETKLQGDTIIGGIPFMRECEKRWTPRRGESKPKEWTVTNKYVGEDEGKVYLCDGTEESIRTIMDFSLNEGDLFPMYGDLGPMVVAVSDTILVNSTDKVPRKCMHLSLVGIEVDVWIEGIGSLYNGLDGMCLDCLGWGAMLDKCVEADSIIFLRNGNVDGVESMEFSTPHDRPIFDLQGRRLTTQPQRGVYIRDGRKYVVGK